MWLATLELQLSDRKGITAICFLTRKVFLSRQASLYIIENLTPGLCFLDGNPGAHVELFSKIASGLISPCTYIT